MSFQTVVINSYKKEAKKQAFIFHWGVYLFNLIYLIVIYFPFIYSISNLITFIDSVLKLYWITQVVYFIKYSFFY